MTINKLDEATNMQVHSELCGVRKAVNALVELCRLHTDGALLDVTRERIDAEQERRFDEFCDDIRECRSNCPSDCPLFTTDVSCKLAWAQLPYAGEAKKGGAE